MRQITSEEIKYRLSDLGVQIGNIAINYITELEKKNAELEENYRKRGDIIISLERQLRLNIHNN